MTQKIAATAQGPMEYRLEGSGPTVMVLNGGHCSRDSRLTHERLVEVGYSVLTPSRPGYDDTPDETGRSAQAAADALAALLDTLAIPVVDVIGISAAGPTALAFAQQYPGKLRKLVLESAVTRLWDENYKRLSPLLFGRHSERFTWAMMRRALTLMPLTVIQVMLKELTVLDVNAVVARMSQADLSFICRMIETSQSGTGFMNDLQHRVDDLARISVPVLAMYSPNDKAVSPRNAQHVAAEVTNCEIYAVPCIPI